MAQEWSPPSDWDKLTSIDAHAAGEPLRIITGGLPPIPGPSMLAKRRYAQQHLDHLRRALILEPRGHADMYGCILTEPVSPDGTLGVLFLHNEGYSTMCGHGIIALVTVVLETGILAVDEADPEIRIDTPAGRITARALIRDGRVREVTFRNVPSFVYALDNTVEVPGRGRVQYDVAFGGAFYAFCRAEELGFRLVPEECADLVEAGRSIKEAVMDTLPIHHPGQEDLSFLYGTIFVGPPHAASRHSRNVCVFADGAVDRSPTGTGVSARAALLCARGELSRDEPFVVESLVGTSFTGRVVEETFCGPHRAVIPEVSGSAHIIGRSEWWLDPQDPVRYGFFLR